MNLKNTYNRIAQDWLSDHTDDTWWVEGTNKFVSLVKPGGYVVDIGCGPGVKTKILMDQRLIVKGIDFSEEFIRIAKEQFPSGDFEVKDISMPLELEKIYNGIFAQAVLLHIPKKDVLQVLSNITEPLKENGYLYISVKERYAEGPEEEVVVENDYGYNYERFFSFFTLDEMKKYLQAIGMRIVHSSINPVGATRWIQVIAQNTALDS